MTRKFFFILSIILLFNCSFDNKTGIWSGSDKEKRKMSEIEKEQKKVISTVKLYSSENLYESEVSNTNQTILTEAKKNESWKMSGMNLKNHYGHIYLSGFNNIFLKKKIGKNKFQLSRNLSQPLIINQKIFISDDTGTIFCIDKRGKILWKKNIYKKLYKKVFKTLTLAIYNNDIYVADNIGFIYKLKILNGEPAWIKNHGIPFKSNIKIFKDKIYLINQDNRLLSFDTNEGTLLWDVRSVSSFIKSQSFLSLAISDEGNLVILNSGGDLMKLNAETGGIYWTLSTVGSLFAHDTDFFNSSNIVLTDDEIIFSTLNSTFSFNSITGQNNWELNIGSTNTPIIDGDNIFLVTNNGFLININRTNGEIIRSTNVLKILKKRKQETEVTGFILGSEKIYIVTRNGHLIICSANLGTPENYRKIGDNINVNPIISSGSLYILTEKSRIIGLN